MKDNLFLVLKGFFIGIANIIPGVSGGTLAITLGIYDRLISTISHIFTNIKENIKFLLPIGIGAVIAILSTSKILSYALDNYLFPTILLFIGAILGGMPMLIKKVSKEKIDPVGIVIFLLTFGLIIAITFLKSGSQVSFENMNIFNYFTLFIVGVIAAATMVVPGVSGSAVLMTLGYYEPIINIIKTITDFSKLGSNLAILIPFGIGVVVGILLIAKILEYLFKNFEVKTYYAIIGFVISSILSIIIQNFFMNGVISISIIEVVIGIILLGLGFIMAYKLGDK